MNEQKARELAALYAQAALAATIYGTAGPIQEALLPLTRQVVELGERLEEKARQADHDPLTGLRSRRCILEHLVRELARTRRHGVPTTAMMLDLDWFKSINDEHGHQIGDQVLGAVGQAIQGVLRTTDMAGRYGGEELLVVASGDVDVVALAERLRLAVFNLEPKQTGCWPRRPTISIGVASVSHGHHEVKRLLLRADAALYSAKRAGRNQVKVG